MTCCFIRDLERRVLNNTGKFVSKLTDEAMVLLVTGNFVFFETFLLKRSVWV
jgi:hypothetical protein